MSLAGVFIAGLASFVPRHPCGWSWGPNIADRAVKPNRKGRGPSGWESGAPWGDPFDAEGRGGAES